MAGLNFQTQTIINVNKDADSNNAPLFEKITTKIDGVEVADVVKIKRDFTFIPENIKSVYVKAGADAEPCIAEVNFATLLNTIKPATGETNYCRIELYVVLEGAEISLFATPWAQKGAPFWVEFAVASTDTAATLAEKVEKLFKQNNVFVLDKNVMSITRSEGVLTFTSNSEYLRFGDITIHSFNAYSGNSNKVAKLETDTSKSTAVQLKQRGVNGFGTYSHLIKDLRLPTAANTSWTALRVAETPVVGALYTQVTVNYCALAPNDGMHAVGERMNSHTTHVFWVKEDVASDFIALFPADKVTDLDDTEAATEAEDELGA